ncbi:hemerythrin domain-containing protein [Natroniella sulfidigena]|uniref:hemerythrin domain-containing protein n=1 Tax=Natroniella sulfidigena TaxID=723921 RepID=UPI00200A3E21|nr:hemerythrin domain-containing protein [Natroniella sulfidigena]MCK8817246.1 hemerythrin domain-containing protein [Natroniella sulfidigena]
MSSIDLLIEEHNNIKRVLKVIRKLCLKILNQDLVDYQSFYDAIDFVRNYADQHHHNKEEEILFERMKQKLDQDLITEPIRGMFSEHDLGRLFISNLEQALTAVKEGNNDAKVDIIANAIAYTDLLYRHIDKEDNAIYKFAENNLPQEILEKVERECEVVEQSAQDKNLQQKYLDLIDKLEKKT